MVGYGRIRRPVEMLLVAGTAVGPSPSVRILVAYPLRRRAQLLDDGEGVPGDRLGRNSPPALP
jgi:hypothetical protein